MIRRPPRSPLFPYTPLSRSACGASGQLGVGRNGCACAATAVRTPASAVDITRSEEHTSELQSRLHLVCRLLLEKKKKNKHRADTALLHHDSCTQRHQHLLAR